MNNFKKHLLTINTFKNGIHAFWVTARTDADGKTRVSRSTIAECLKRAGADRGHCIKIG
jgi:hypothetical protein